MLTSAKQTLPRSINFVSALKFLAFLILLVIIWHLETALVRAISPGAGAAPETRASLESGHFTSPLTQTARLTGTAAAPEVCATPEEAPVHSRRPMYLIRELLGRAALWTGNILPRNTLQERVNILLLGADLQGGERYGHTDTMILVTVDPVSKSAAMLSIPRDLWVTIPGYGENRINQAYRLGEIKKHPGGGPALLQETIEANLGVPVHFYGMISFEGFKQVIDTLDGVEVCVQKTIDTASYWGYAPAGYEPEAYYNYVFLPPDHKIVNIMDQSLGFDETNGYYKFFYIEAGLHTLDGEAALHYARTRATVTADFARARRQQDILLAIRRKALQLGIIPKLPDLWNAMSGMIKTDLQLTEAIQLARLAYEIDLEHIRAEAISLDQTIDYTTKGGAEVLLPDQEKIKTLIDDLFGSSQPTTPATYAEHIADEAGVKN